VVRRETREGRGSSPKAEGVNHDKIKGKAQSGDGGHAKCGGHGVGKLVHGHRAAGNINEITTVRCTDEEFAFGLELSAAIEVLDGDGGTRA
jgi:hypothetical protein